VSPEGDDNQQTNHHLPQRTLDKRTSCEYGYMIGTDLTISTGFLTDHVPLTKLFGADQEFRRRIEAAQVKDFRWPDSTAGN
jgi:hypothetical protein